MEHLASNKRCKLLRCALEVIDRTKSADAIRITTVPAPCIKPATYSHPCEYELQNQDRVQRRKEKKRRKIELRRQQQEQSLINSEVITATSFCNYSSNTIPSTVPESVQAKIIVKPLIILDVNGILCHRLRHKSQESVSHSKAKRAIHFRPSIGHIANTDIVPRSDLPEFLTLLSKHFCLAVWTSATRKTAKQLVQLLFPQEVRENLVFIWHRNFCNMVNTAEKKTSDDVNNIDLESNSHKQNEILEKKPSHDDQIAIKSLAKVWATYPIWNATNTLLLDDSPEKCPTKYIKNALHPTKISGTTTEIEGGVYVDNDEENQDNQRCFFKLLAQNWPETLSSEYLSSFLEANAKEYNMGWCKTES